MSAFLDTLPLSDEERQKLKALGASTPFALLSMRHASREAFDAHIGAQRADEIASQLEKLLSADELEQLRRPVALPGALGGRMPRNPD
jgi:hypothetical protein